MFTQFVLPYGFESLEPYIDMPTMLTHYMKHHAAYTVNLNAAVEKTPQLSGKDIVTLLRNLTDITSDEVRLAVRNNGGGFYNHNLYFSTLSPSGGGSPSGALADRIIHDYGSSDALKEALSKAALAHFGSGWAWLSVDGDGKLLVGSSANQDNPLMDSPAYTPILGIDVWEHAYYLKYKNLRADYVKAFWQVVDWEAVAKLYEIARI